MKYIEITLPYNHDQSVISSTINDYVINAKREHMTGMRQQRVRILGISETYNPAVSGINAADDLCFLTDKGYLYVKIDDGVYHEYNLFEVNTGGSAPKYSTVYYISEPPTTQSVNFENTHRLVLTKRSTNNTYAYWAVPIECGKMGSDRLYRLDMDGYNYNNVVTLPDSDVYFKNINTNSGNGTRDILINAKQFLYINTEPNVDTAGITIEIRDPGTGASNALFKYKNEPYYFISRIGDNDPDNDPGTTEVIDSGITIINDDSKTVDDFIFLNIKGTQSSPDQIILEVY